MDLRIPWSILILVKHKKAFHIAPGPFPPSVPSLHPASSKFTHCRTHPHPPPSVPRTHRTLRSDRRWGPRVCRPSSRRMARTLRTGEREGGGGGWSRSLSAPPPPNAVGGKDACYARYRFSAFYARFRFRFRGGAASR